MNSESIDKYNERSCAAVADSDTARHDVVGRLEEESSACALHSKGTHHGQDQPPQLLHSSYSNLAHSTNRAQSTRET